MISAILALSAADTDEESSKKTKRSFGAELAGPTGFGWPGAEIGHAHFGGAQGHAHFDVAPSHAHFGYAPAHEHFDVAPAHEHFASAPLFGHAHSHLHQHHAIGYALPPPTLLGTHAHTIAVKKIGVPVPVKV